MSTETTGPSSQASWVPTADSFAARLALVRHRMGWNVKEAARECGVGAATWRDWEFAGALPRNIVTIAMTIATKTGCDYLWLVHGPQRGEINKPTREYSTGIRVVASIEPNRTIGTSPIRKHRPGRAVRRTRPTAGLAVRPHTPVAV